MALGKWIGGALGWIIGGGSILGAIAGYCIGSLLDDSFEGATSRAARYSVTTVALIRIRATASTVLLVAVPLRNSATPSFSPCLFSHHTSLRLTAKSCIQKWNLFAVSSRQLRSASRTARRGHIVETL